MDATDQRWAGIIFRHENWTFLNIFKMENAKLKIENSLDTSAGDLCKSRPVQSLCLCLYLCLGWWAVWLLSYDRQLDLPTGTYVCRCVCVCVKWVLRNADRHADSFIICQLQQQQVSQCDRAGGRGGSGGEVSARESCGNHRVNKFVCQSKSKVGKVSTTRFYCMLKCYAIVFNYEDKKEKIRKRKGRRWGWSR